MPTENGRGGPPPKTAHPYALTVVRGREKPTVTLQFRTRDATIQGSVTQDLLLAPVDGQTAGERATQRVEKGRAVYMELQDGASLYALTNFLTPPTSDQRVAATAAYLPEQGVHLVSPVYSLLGDDQFNEVMVLRIPYDVGGVQALGLTQDALQIFWRSGDDVGWTPITGYVIDISCLVTTQPSDRLYVVFSCLQKLGLTPIHPISKPNIDLKSKLGQHFRGQGLGIRAVGGHDPGLPFASPIREKENPIAIGRPGRR